MIVEYCQLLSMAVWVHDPSTAQQLHADGRIYNAPNKCGKHAHFNHPSAIWVRQSKQHFDWLYEVTRQLGFEYDKRYGHKHGRKHSSITKCLIHLQSNSKFPDLGWSQPPQCMPDEYKMNDSLEAYRTLYRHDKVRFAKYTNTFVPPWLYVITS